MMQKLCKAPLFTILFRSVTHFSASGHQRLIAPNFLPVFACHKQHPETFTIMPVEVFVVHFMRPSNGADIGIIAAGKPLETLMNDYIMHQEIGEAIGHDAKANRLHPPDMVVGAEKYQQHAGDSEDHKKGIIFLKKTRFHLMVVAMQIPQKPMHHVSVGKPGYTFHYYKRAN
jgi:hypothetical protein